jgi:hypothetical protein
MCGITSPPGMVVMKARPNVDTLDRMVARNDMRCSMMLQTPRPAYGATRSVRKAVITVRFLASHFSYPHGLVCSSTGRCAGAGAAQSH